jgi:hypothetical protein
MIQVRFSIKNLFSLIFIYKECFHICGAFVEWELFGKREKPGRWVNRKSTEYGRTEWTLEGQLERYYLKTPARGIAADPAPSD